MSILDELPTLCASGDGRLVRMDPLLPGRNERVLFAARALYEEIKQAGDQNDSDSFRIGQLLADIEQFTSGRAITVGYGSDDHCMMKLLAPTVDEVWEMRSRDPKPSLRVFGRFAGPDVFIATHKARRRDLGGWGSEEWAIEIRRCKALWRQIFPSYQPFSGSLASDYITENVHPVSDLP